jgi:transcription elongation factor GreA
MEKTHLSPAAHQRLREELDWRSGERRREISTWIERAREHGDIRENADYDAAKNEQGHNEARIRQLDAILKEAEIVEGGTTSDVAGPGTIVEVRWLGDDDTTNYLIGSIEERRTDIDVISSGSPLGRALDGHGAGDKVQYEVNDRVFDVEIVSVRPAL